jgi:hypothetical protein
VGAPSHPTPEGNAAGAPSTVPNRRPKEDHPASESAPPVLVPYEGPAYSNDDGSGSISPGSLFESSENPKVSNPPKAPDLSEQRDRTEQDPVPHSRTRDTAGVERGDLLRI